MNTGNLRLRALLYLLVLFPLWWVQRTQASELPRATPSSAGGSSSATSDHDDDGDDDGDHDDGDDDDCDHDDDGDDDGDDGDDDGDDDDDCDITDCNDNGIDDAVDIAEGTSRDGDHNGVPDECEPGIRTFCEGDGAANGGLDCPCLNNAPQGTTAGCLNRDGVGASLTGSGVPSVSNDTLLLTVTGIPNGAPGFFFQGQANAGFNPFFNGLRCIGGPFIRMAKIHGLPGGNSLPLAGDPPISEQFDIPAGATRYYQVLYRDGSNPLCPHSANASNGLIVVWGL